MQLTAENINYVLALVAIVSVFFGVWGKIRDPQIKTEKNDALLAQQIQWTIEANERRFIEIQKNIKEAFTLAQNHTHSVEIKVDKLAEQVASMSLSMKGLSTIIEERIPRK